MAKAKEEKEKKEKPAEKSSEVMLAPSGTDQGRNKALVIAAITIVLAVTITIIGNTLSSGDDSEPTPPGLTKEQAAAYWKKPQAVAPTTSEGSWESISLPANVEWPVAAVYKGSRHEICAATRGCFVRNVRAQGDTLWYPVAPGITPWDGTSPGNLIVKATMAMEIRVRKAVRRG